MRPALLRPFGPSFALLTTGFAVALVIRLASLDMRQVWVDEAFTQFAVSLDWPNLIADRVGAGHSPLYFVMLKGLGFDPADILPLRAASAVMDAAACAVFGAAVLRINSRRAAGFGMALYALSPLLLVWSQNARPYAMLMLALAIGVHGAMGVISGTQSRNRVSADAVAMAMGLSVAALTLTAGAIAALLVILAPLALPLLRQNLRVWLVAAIPPLIAITTMAALVSFPAAATLSAQHWTDRAAPFSTVVLADLARALIVGDRFRPDEQREILGLVPSGPMAAISALLLGWVVCRGMRDLRRTPALVPLVALTLVYPLVLIALSTSTSLLIPRYFLPALGPALMLAGIGLATVRGRAGTCVAGTTVAVASLLALNQSLMQGPQHRPDLVRTADLILADVEPRTTVFRAPDDGLGFDLMAILLPRALGPVPNPRVIAATPDAVAAALPEAVPAWFLAGPETWTTYKARVPPPDCLLRLDFVTLAYWGTHPPPDCR